MFFRITLLLILLPATLCLHAQMKLGNNPTSLNSASLLELESTDKGFVLPHVFLTSLTSSSPLPSTMLSSTMIYNTNNALPSGIGRGVYYWDSLITRWIPATPFQTPGVTNYVAKWTSASTIGTSTILYDNGTNIGINTANPQNSLDVFGSQAIGNYAGSSSAPTNGLIVSGNVGIGTASPASGSKLDVAGNFKVGSAGTVHKNMESFSASVNTSVPAEFVAVSVAGVTVLGINAGINYSDITVTLPNAITSTQASVHVSPSFDFPVGVYICFARVISTTQVKIRLMNANTSSQNVSGNFYITVSEF